MANAHRIWPFRLLPRMDPRKCGMALPVVCIVLWETSIHERLLIGGRELRPSAPGIRYLYEDLKQYMSHEFVPSAFTLPTLHPKDQSRCDSQWLTNRSGRYKRTVCDPIAEINRFREFPDKAQCFHADQLKTYFHHQLLLFETDFYCSTPHEDELDSYIYSYEVRVPKLCHSFQVPLGSRLLRSTMKLVNTK